MPTRTQAKGERVQSRWTIAAAVSAPAVSMEAVPATIRTSRPTRVASAVERQIALGSEKHSCKYFSYRRYHYRSHRCCLVATELAECDRSETRSGSTASDTHANVYK